MKKDYRYYLASSGLSAENIAYLEAIEAHNPGDARLKGLQSDYQAEASLTKEDVVDLFKQQGASSAKPKVNNNAQVLAEIGYRFANLNPLTAPLTEQTIIKGLAQYGYEVNEPIDPKLIKQFCGPAAIDVSAMMDQNIKADLIQRFIAKTNFSADEKKQMLKGLVAANDFEKYLDLKFVGQKRFSLEGNDALIPFVNRVIGRLHEYDYASFSAGMAHRGRLNVMLNVFGMLSGTLLDMFSGKAKSINKTSGDVKYHLGLDSVRHFDGYDIHLSLANNPSHLEFITPVVMGQVKAKQVHDDKSHFGMTIHGDAAVAGQGIVMEAVAMSKIPAHNIGGMLHVVLDNQIGFTNERIEDMRSAYGCADIAKLIEAPIFYANADDVEACTKVADLALDYIAKYKRSAFVVIMGYRRNGHNEGDEPSMTSPDKYADIKGHPIACDVYAKQLADAQVVDATEYKAMREDYKKRLDEGKATVEHTDLIDVKKDYAAQKWDSNYDFKVVESTLKELAAHFTQVPKDLKFHRSIERLIKQRQAMAKGEQPLDWGMCELLAYACILSQGHSIRINGQDAQRGTFSHRHAVLHAQNHQSYDIMKSVCAKGAHFDVINSFLSEQGVLGFEYGYSIDAQDDLVIWEAQFGDFVNGAQVIIDQFISSGLEKWNQTSKLIMYLPHGYEGMGPEHTSARLERFLQLSAQNNIQVCVPTSPKQMFALLIRQYFRYYDRPLIVLTPKSLLRHPAAVTDFKTLAENPQFDVIIQDQSIDHHTVKRVILCTGKVYYDLLAYRDAHDHHVALVRIEQLYPFPAEALTQVLHAYKDVKSFIWCQEEPENQGAWLTMKSRIEACLPQGNTLTYAGRAAAAAPAVGYHNRHLEEQAKLVSEAFNI